MYKLTILFFFSTVFNSQSLIDVYQLKFENKDVFYTLQIKNSSLVFENQPDVTVYKEGNTSNDAKQNASGKIYKIIPNATWQEGLKIGEIGVEDIAHIGAEEIEDIARIGAEEIEDIARIGEQIIDDIARIKKDALFEMEDYNAYEIKLGYELVVIEGKSTNTGQKIEISENGFYIYIIGNELILFK